MNPIKLNKTIPVFTGHPNKHTVLFYISHNITTEIRYSTTGFTRKI